MRSIHRTLRFASTAAIAVALVAMTVGVASAAGPKGKDAYNSVPDNLPGNVPSQAFQATQTSEFGDSVTLEKDGKKVRSVDVILSSWGCQSGAWHTSNCVTSPGATFSHPITLNIYSVNATTGQPDELLVTDTQTFAVPYRPSTDAGCTGGRWFSDTDETCYNGYAAPITFNLGGGVKLPEDVIWTVAFNTSGYGSSPLGYGTACASTPQGCPYDSLNVGVESFPDQPSTGTDVDPAGAVLDSDTADQYCDGGTGGVGFLRLDNGCWTGFRPLATIRTK